MKHQFERLPNQPRGLSLKACVNCDKYLFDLAWLEEDCPGDKSEKPSI